MSAAYHVTASVVEGPDEGEYKKIHRNQFAAMGDFMRLIPISEDVVLHYSS